MKNKIKMLCAVFLTTTFFACGPSAEEVLLHKKYEEYEKQNEKLKIEKTLEDSNTKTLSNDLFSRNIREKTFYQDGMTYKLYFENTGNSLFIINLTIDSLQKLVLECQLQACKQ